MATKTGLFGGSGVRVQGIDKAIKSLRKFEKELNSHLHDGALLSARPLAIEMRNRAPKLDGDLRRSIQVGRLRNRFGREVAAYIRVSQKIAPHAHLIEFGTAVRRHKSGKLTGIVQPIPFFRSVLDQIALGVFTPITKAGIRALAKFRAIT